MIWLYCACPMLSCDMLYAIIDNDCVNDIYSQCHIYQLTHSTDIAQTHVAFNNNNLQLKKITLNIFITTKNSATCNSTLQRETNNSTRIIQDYDCGWNWMLLLLETYWNNVLSPGHIYHNEVKVVLEWILKNNCKQVIL